MQQNVIPFFRQESDCAMLTATVKATSGQAVIIDTGATILNASIAFSCLVEPLPGDKVFINRVGADYYIVSILQRSAHANMALAFPGDVQFNARAGAIAMVAKRELDFTGAEAIRMTAAKTHINSAETALNSGHLSVNARAVDASAGHAKITAQAIDTVAKRISQRVETLVRWVEGVETLHIGSLLQNVRKLFSAHAQQTVITAQKDVRIDGERIHMG